MRKVTIVTVYNAVNYGAILQAYALQRFLKENMNVNVQMLRYETEAMWKAANLSFLSSLRINGLKFPLILPNLVCQKLKERKFYKFRYRELTETKRYLSQKSIFDNPPDSDIIITGSDQVFNPHYVDYQVFYLGFTHSDQTAIAYAPSFGRYDIPGDRVNEIRRLLRRITCISSREDEGADLIKQLIGVTFPTVVDPVFLLGETEWSMIENPVRFIKKPYILCYALVGYEKQIEIAREISKVTGYKILLIHSGRVRDKQGIAYLQSSGPREFIWLFRNAEYVVTDSFHGTAFSILFKKQFYIHIALPNKSSRITNLLKHLGIHTRIIDNINTIDIENQSVNYRNIEALLQKEINFSKQFLTDAIEHSRNMNPPNSR